MYSRNRDGDESRITLPENYDGTAFMEKPKEQQPDLGERSIKVLGAPSADAKVSPVMMPLEEEAKRSSAAPQKKSEDSSMTFGFLDKIPLWGLFKKGCTVGEGIGIRLPRIGTEEILIIAMALFLFFSKDGDRECAIMLAMLLLISN